MASVTAIAEELLKHATPNILLIQILNFGHTIEKGCANRQTCDRQLIIGSL